MRFQTTSKKPGGILFPFLNHRQQDNDFLPFDGAEHRTDNTLTAFGANFKEPVAKRRCVRSAQRGPEFLIENRETSLSSRPVQFCPGVTGGVQWIGPAYDPIHNLILPVRSIGAHRSRWRRLKKHVTSRCIGRGQAVALINPESFSARWTQTSDSVGQISAIDADTGAVVRSFKTPHPVLSGVTPTGGGLVFVGDIGGTFNAFDAESGRLLWSKILDGALSGGVITYRDKGAQRIAVAIGMTSRQ